MTQAKLRQVVLETVFWGSLVLVFIPLVLLYVFQCRLENKLSQTEWHQGWQLYNGENQLLVADIQFPADLRKYPQTSVTSHWKYVKHVWAHSFAQYQRPFLLLGRIGDADKVMLNGCRVGSTGLDSDNKQSGWTWGLLRAYEIPKHCLMGSSEAKKVLLEVEVYRWGIANFGIYAGPVGLGEYDDLHVVTMLTEVCRFYVFAFFGILLIAIGIYFLFVYVLVPSRAYNGAFALFSMSTGIYELMVSTLPYQISSDGILPMRLNFFSAAMGASTFLLFLTSRFSFVSKRFFQIMAWGSLVLFVASLFQRTFRNIFMFYSLWFPFFLIILFIAYIQFISHCRKNCTRDGWRYALGYTVFMGCCMYDVVVSITHAGFPYLIPYGFATLLAGVALTLAKEYGDAFLHVESQVDERTKDLSTALNQLRAMEKMKESFFANVSHDFKTPIAVALGSIEQLKQKQNQQNQPDLLHAERSLQQLLDMVGDILDTVKAESGTLRLLWDKANPAQLLKIWCMDYDQLCHTKRISLEVCVEGYEQLYVPMDVNKVRRVFDNLISNAIKFMKNEAGDNGCIQVDLTTDQAYVYISISDNGMGVPSAERDKIFDRYFQSSRTSLKEHGGSGIGLSFAKEVVVMQNGRIWVEDSVWGGSKFVVALPLSQDVEITGEHRNIDNSKKGVDLRGSLDVSYPLETPTSLKENIPNVLVAEDNPEIAQVVCNILAEEYNVFFAFNGERAFQQAQARFFDCLVTDLVMPAMRGDELIRKLRAHPKYRAVPMIVLSSHSDETTVAELLRHGANDYVTKPFRRDILLARVKAQIESFKTSRWIAENEKVIELGFLAGGMAHQIRNGLNSLKNQISYQEKIIYSLLQESETWPVEQRTKVSEKLKQSKQIIDRAMQRIERLTDSVRTYSSGSKQKVLITISDSMELARTIHLDEIRKKSIQLEIQGLEGLKISGFSSFHEVFVNLIGNAIDACKDDGTGRIFITGKEQMDMIEISVQDNGMGIDPSVLPRICQPFFTTKAPGEGTGLGLYVVRDIVEGQHGGKFEIHSVGLQKGAAFIVRIPKEAPLASINGDIALHGISVS